MQIPTPSYPIYLNEDIELRLTDFFEKNHYSQIAVLVDENTLKYCYTLVKDKLPGHILIQIKSGEENKNLTQCAMIWEQMSLANFDRNALLINLGGGVIGDMGGFAASCYKRGIDFIQIPTTLLSQVDSSIGGKLGIDFLNYKNQIGCFNNPKAVFIQSVFFKTLPTRELYSGFAEIIKHNLIADKNGFEILQSLNIQKLDEQQWTNLIAHSLHIKNNIVQQDPFEKNIRKSLNFGHTIGHAIETYFLTDSNTKLLHGEAVAIGMITETFIAYHQKMLSETSLKNITNYILQHYQFNSLPTEDIDTFWQLILQDKKNTHAKVNCTLLKEIGHYVINQNITKAEVLLAFEFFNQQLVK